jgi:glycerol-3-phosphate dehydrogenase
VGGSGGCESPGLPEWAGVSMTPGAADVAVIGAGAVGTAIARTLACHGVDCLLVEAAGDVGAGTSKAATAIVHTGFDAVPGSLESRLLRRGSALLHDYARRAGIAVERTGALVVAWTPEQAAMLPGLVAGAHRNEWGDVRHVGADELYRAEPNLAPGALGAVLVPGESIICPWSIPLAYARQALAAGARLVLRSRVTGVHVEGREYHLATTGGVVRCRWVVNAAGLYADLIDDLMHGEGVTLQPRRAEMLVFDKFARPLLNSILLPVPDGGSVGMLVTPTVYGNVALGPAVSDTTGRHDTATTKEGLAALLAAGEKILPRLMAEEVTAAYAGMLAATAERGYRISVDAMGRYVCVAGTGSTGLSASLAIAEHVAALLADAGLKLAGFAEPEVPAMPALGEAAVRPYADDARIAADPDYGRVVCHCERVTRGEISAALGGPLPPADLAGLARRTRALTGRCQGSCCAAAVGAMFASTRPGAARAGREPEEAQTAEAHR